jgi:hypothetical protein
MLSRATTPFPVKVRAWACEGGALSSTPLLWGQCPPTMLETMRGWDSLL